MLKRTLCALMVFLMLTAGAGRAEERSLVGFDLSFETVPADSGFLKGLMELLDMAAVSGTLDRQDGAFALSGSLTLNRSARTQTAFSLRGTGQNVVLTGDFLGDVELALNNDALVEFGNKLYNHLGLPVQRCTLLWPYVHGRALVNVTGALRTVFEGKAEVSKAEALQAAEAIAALPRTDNSLYHWMLALGGETGFDETLTAALTGLPDWVEEHIAEEGLFLRAQPDGSQSWVSGEHALVTFSASRLELALPGLLDGNDLFLSAGWSEAGFDCAVTLGAEGELLRAAIHGSGLKIGSGEVSLTLSASGMAVSHLSAPAFDESGVWRTVPLAEGQSLNLSLTGPIENLVLSSDGQRLMTLCLRLSEKQPTGAFPNVEPGPDAVSFLMVADQSLADLMARIAQPALKSLLPLVAEAPASFISSVMDIVDEVGLMSMLTGEGFEDDEWDDDWGEDEDWGEYEDWSEYEDWEGWDGEGEDWYDEDEGEEY